MTLIDAGWLAAFSLSLVLVLVASDSLVSAIEAAGDRYLWPAGVVGLLAAAGADGPEVSASLIALRAGAHDISLGVILGSNLFNLAALIGLPILLVGSIAVQRYSLLINGLPMLLTTILATALLLDQQQRAPIEVLLLVVLVGQVCLLLVRPEVLLQRLAWLRHVVTDSSAHILQEERAREREADAEQGYPGGWLLLVKGVLATAVVIGGCDVLVNATLYLGPRAGLPHALTGLFGLAALTSLPNLWVALSLARRQRGEVLVSAVCNSNTINALFGICVPALIVTLHATGSTRTIDIPALLLLTLLSLGLLWQGKGLDRRGALLIVACYLLFAVIRLSTAG
jgi:cation:H+ antiporter